MNNLTEYEEKSLEVLNAILEKLNSINEKLSDNWYLKHIDTYTQGSQSELEEINKNLKQVLENMK